MTFLALYVFLTLWAPLYLAVLQSRSCWLMDHRSAVSVLHHHLSVSVCVCESVCSHVCVPAHSSWQCSSNLNWTLSCLPTTTPAACLAWQSACLPKCAPGSPLISAWLSFLRLISYRHTAHLLLFISPSETNDCSVLQKKKIILHQNFILILMWLRKINVYFICIIYCMRTTCQKFGIITIFI